MDKFKNVEDPGAVNPKQAGPKNKTDFSHKMEFNGSVQGLEIGCERTKFQKRQVMEAKRGKFPVIWLMSSTVCSLKV
jgi:hypothetical protein